MFVRYLFSQFTSELTTEVISNFCLIDYEDKINREKAEMLKKEAEIKNKKK